MHCVSAIADVLLTRVMVITAQAYDKKDDYYPLAIAAEIFREHFIHLAVMALNDGLKCHIYLYHA